MRLRASGGPALPAGGVRAGAPGRPFSLSDFGVTAGFYSPLHGGNPAAEGFTVVGTRVDTCTDAWGNLFGDPPFDIGGHDKLQLDASSVLGGRDALVTDPSVHGTLSLSWLYSLTGGPVGTGDYWHCWVGQLTAASTVGAGLDTASFVGQIAVNMVGVGTRNSGALVTGPSQSFDAADAADLTAPHIYEVMRVDGIRYVFVDGVYQVESTCTVNLVGYQGLGSSQVASHPGQQAKTWAHLVAAGNALTFQQRQVMVDRLSVQFGIYL